MSDSMKTIGADLLKAFNTGVSYMMPIVVVGGVFLALSLASGDATAGEGMVVTNPFLKNLGDIGMAGFAMMIPVLSGYIAYSLAGKPGLTPGFVTGYLASVPIGENHVQTGFLGAMLLGILSGYVARWLKKKKVSPTLMAIMPILVIPILATFTVSMIYIYLLVTPIGFFMQWLIGALSGLQGGSALLIGIIVGAMAAFDMGGPINKTATGFTLALMAEGIYGPNGAYRIAVAIPPLGLALSTFISRKKWEAADRNMGVSAAFMGLIGITEGAIPFAVKGLKTVLPSIIIGSAVGAGLGMLHGVECMVPHGGLIVLPAVNQAPFWYAVDMLIGTVVTAGCLHVLRPDIKQSEEQAACPAPSSQAG
ncbi:PTS fructose transporter subunit IIC [Selenomonas ruminantium]|uniref:PTS fructose transporter subunit IIC n=1 Tax=Selenomonas ruminantium TaxID=971 RepID=UPI001569FBFF|nr:PTS fructose transporter subunit IIC [Selenomonas ruminantium]